MDQYIILLWLMPEVREQERRLAICDALSLGDSRRPLVVFPDP